MSTKQSVPEGRISVPWSLDSRRIEAASQWYRDLAETSQRAEESGIRIAMHSVECIATSVPELLQSDAKTFWMVLFDFTAIKNKFMSAKDRSGDSEKVITQSDYK